MSRIHLKITNHTDWSTADLRRFLLAAMRAKGIEQRRVIIKYAKRTRRNLGALHGYGYFPSTRGQSYGVFCLMLPTLSALRNGVDLDVEKLAQITEHEIDHTLGLDHKDMQDWWTLPVPWADGMVIAWAGDPIEVAKTEPMPPERRRERLRVAMSETVASRATHARKMLAKADTRLKRAKTLQAKWSAKVRYYDKAGR